LKYYSETEEIDIGAELVNSRGLNLKIKLYP